MPSPLLLAEELSIADIQALFDARERAPIEFSHNEMERDFWLGGFSLELALHPDTDPGAAEDYFDDANIYWQRVTDHADTRQKTWNIRTCSSVLSANLPSFMARKAAQQIDTPSDLSPEEWDNIDRNSAVILQNLQGNPLAGDDDKAFFSAQIGTQLLCGRMSILTYPATGREALISPLTVIPENQQLAHRLYAIENGSKVPLQVRVRKGNIRSVTGAHVVVPFGDLAQRSLQVVAPEVAENYPKRGQCALLVGEWLVQMAYDGNDLPNHAMEVIDRMGDNIADRIAKFVA